MVARAKDGAASGTPRAVDVAIVGGGVAGAALGAALAGAGFGVVVIEREARFRDRVRGESVHPWGVAEADKLGLLPVLRGAGGRELPLWQRYTDRVPNEPYRWADDVPGGYGEWTIFHPALQEALLAHATTCGADVVRPARVSGFRRVGGPELDVAVGEDTVTVRARLVVGADGRSSAARRWVGARTLRDPVHHAIGGCLLDGVALDEASAHQAFFPGGMTMTFPQGNGRARAYVVCDGATAESLRGQPGNVATAFIATCAATLPDGAYRDAVAAGPSAFFPNADVWASQVAAGDVVLVGDAAGANDPSLGQGLSLAFRDARALRDLLVADQDWPRAIAEFATHRAASFAVLREHARWIGLLTTETGPEADARRERVTRARETDPTAGGFAAIFALGPDELTADDAARRRFFGED
jgi:2-polyprenyl-6-methoxyphenol hydroxylase-like FAD-dependent oxidoreductase